MTLPNKGPYAHLGAGKSIAEWGAECEAAFGKPPDIVQETVYGAVNCENPPFGFSHTLNLLFSRYHVKRKNWQASIGWPPGADNILMFWPSGFVELWRPTLADIQAADWERAT